MNKSILRAALKYRITDNIRGLLLMCGLYLLVLILLVATINVAISGADGEGLSVSGGDIAFAITLFVYGIVTIRTDLPFFTQFGLSRRTVFIVQIITALITALIASVLCLLVLLLLQGLAHSALGNGIYAAGLYNTLFNGGSPVRDFGGSLAEIVVTATMFGMALSLGSLISLLYYRLNKLGKALLSIVGGSLLLFGLPLGSSIPALRPLYQAMNDLFRTMFASPGALGLGMLLLFAIIMAANWLLLRRAPLR